MRLLICTQAVDKNDPILGFFHRWIEEFAGQCEKVTVVCLRLGEQSLPQNVEVISLGEKGRIMRAIRLLRIASAKQKEYDAVFVHMNPEYIVVAGLLWRVLRKRISLWYAHKSITLFLRIATLISDVICTATPSTFPLKSPKVVVAGQGIDVQAFVPVSHELRPGLRLISVGRIAPSKGLTTMVKAVTEAAKTVQGISFQMYGIPTTREEMRYERDVDSLIAIGKANEYITLPGPVRFEKLPAALGEADAFLTMGTTGGMDKAVLDAMACGLPVIGANFVFTQLLENAGTAVPLGDEHALAQAIQSFAGKNLEERVRIGVMMRDEVVKNFSLSSFVGRLIVALSIPSKS